MYELGRNHIQFCSLPPPVPILRVGRLLVSRGTHVAARERSRGATSPTDREREDWCKRDVTRFAPPFSLISYLSVTRRHARCSPLFTDLTDRQTDGI